MQISVETPVQLQQTQLQAMRAKLEKIFNQPVELTQTVDPKLIAGLRINTPEGSLDRTILGGLNQLKHQLFTNTNN